MQGYWLPILTIILGLGVLVYSADCFVDGASKVASVFKIPPLIIGMIIIGFGTSAPEMLVSVLSSLQGSPGIAIGNAYGSNITNIALILGITALIHPIKVDSKILRKELPLLLLAGALSFGLIYDGEISNLDGYILLTAFGVLILWMLLQAKSNKNDRLELEFEKELINQPVRLRLELGRLFFGLVLLIGSSRALVWAAVEIAHKLNVDDILIGLTVVAVGTSLPELAASVVAARKGESDIALGNIIGSNLFNTLAVVGLSSSIQSFSIDDLILKRDFSVMIALTISLFFLASKVKQKENIGRLEGGFLLISYIAYTSYLISGFNS